MNAVVTNALACVLVNRSAKAQEVIDLGRHTMICEDNTPQRWIWVKWRGESYAIDAYSLVAFGRSKTDGEIWFQLRGDNGDRCCESSLVEFCNAAQVPYRPLET